MSRLVLVESDARGLRAALLVDRRLEAIEIDRASKPTLVGAVMPADSVRVLKGMGEIVRLADGTDALLERSASVGRAAVLQVLRDGSGDKLPLAGRSVALVGRALVHLPLDSGIRASRRLGGPPEARKALQAGLEARAGGWIIRSAASLVGEADWRAEIAALAAEGARLAAGASLPAPDAARRLLCDHGLPAPDGIQVAGLAAARSVRRWCEAFAPSLLARIEQHSGGGTLFDLHDLDAAIDALAQPRIALPGGGSLIIERTQALAAIDVNSGAEANTLAVNLAAAPEIARQLRLRHIGGIVVIDFISLPRARDRARTEAALAAALASDPTRTQILPMSRLGLVELSRERRGPELELESDA